MGNPLDDSVLRFERAKRHLDRLDAEVAELFEGDGFKGIDAEPKRDGEYFTYRWIVREVPRIDPFWPVLIGEFLYNLRSSLDYMAVGHGGHGGFPIHPSYEKFHEVDRSGKPTPRSGTKLTAGMTSPVKSAIEAAQPYRVMPESPRADPLWLLEDFRNRDAHAQLHVVCAVATKGEYEFLDGELTEVTSRMKLGPLKENTEIMRVAGKIVRPAPAELTARFRTTLTISFERTTPGGEQVAGLLLNSMLNRVSNLASAVRAASRAK